MRGYIDIVILIVSLQGSRGEQGERVRTFLFYFICKTLSFIFLFRDHQEIKEKKFVSL